MRASQILAIAEVFDLLSIGSTPYVKLDSTLIILAITKERLTILTGVSASKSHLLILYRM